MRSFPQICQYERRKRPLRQKRNDENKGHSKRARRAEAPRAPMRSFPQVCQSTSYIMASRICCSALSVADQVFSSSFSYVNTERRKRPLRQKRNDENKGHSKRARRAEAPRAPMRSFPQVCQSTSYIMASRICCSALSVADQVFSSSFSYVNTHSLSSGSARRSSQPP